MRFIKPGAATKIIPQAAPKQAAQGQSAKGGYNFQKLADKANETGNPNGYKYQMAVNIARDNLKDDKDVDDEKFKTEIDKAYKDLGASNSGRDMRGENAFTDAVNGMQDFIDDVTTAGGKGIDWLWDNTAGNLAGVVDKDFGQDVKNLVNEDSGKMIADGLIDAGLSAVPVVGIPAVLAKSVVQNADDIGEALSGRDSITGEKMELPQQLAKGGAAALNIGLSALPGIGKLKNAAFINKIGDNADDIIRGLGSTSGGSEGFIKAGAGGVGENVVKNAAGEAGENAAKAAVNDAADQGIKQIDQALADAPSASLSDVMNNIRAADLGKEYLQQLKHPVDTFRAFGQNAVSTARDLPGSIADAARAFKNTEGGLFKKGAAASEAYNQLPKQASANQLANYAYANMGGERASRPFVDFLGEGAANTATSLGLPAASTILQGLGEGRSIADMPTDLLDSFFLTPDDGSGESSVNMPAMFATVMGLPGTRRLTGNNIGPSGRYSRVPAASTRAASAQRYMNDYYAGDPGDARSEDDMMSDLDYLMGGDRQ